MHKGPFESITHFMTSVPYLPAWVGRCRNQSWSCYDWISKKVLPRIRTFLRPAAKTCLNIVCCKKYCFSIFPTFSFKDQFNYWLDLLEWMDDIRLLLNISFDDITTRTLEDDDSSSLKQWSWWKAGCPIPGKSRRDWRVKNGRGEQSSSSCRRTRRSAWAVRILSRWRKIY